MRQSRYDVAPERARLTIDDHDEDHDDEPATSAGRNGTSTAGKEKDNGLRRFPGCGGGILDDITRRARYCGLDYSNGAIYGSKTLSAALFMLFATMFSTVALGALIESATKKRIGLSEYLIMNSLAGVTHALLGAQPLLVLRPTGPITAITMKLSDTADFFGLDFYEYLSATGLCVATLMVVVAMTEFSRHISTLTAFTHEIFACFVCSIYVVDGVSEILLAFNGTTMEEFGMWLFTANLALVTFGVSAWLHTARGWRILPETVLAKPPLRVAVVAHRLPTNYPRPPPPRRCARSSSTMT